MRLLGRLTDGLGVGERAVRVDADEVGTRNLELLRPRARREHERAVLEPLTAGERHLVLVRMNRLHGRLEQELDDGLLVVLQLLYERRVALEVAAQESLRQRWPMVRRIGLGRDDGDVLLTAGRAVLRCEPGAGEPSSDDDDVLCHGGVVPGSYRADTVPYLHGRGVASARFRRGRPDRVRAPQGVLRRPPLRRGLVSPAPRRPARARRAERCGQDDAAAGDHG